MRVQNKLLKLFLILVLMSQPIVALASFGVQSQEEMHRAEIKEVSELGNPIYEPSFIYDEDSTRVEDLERELEGADLEEVAQELEETGVAYLAEFIFTFH